MYTKNSKAEDVLESSPKVSDITFRSIFLAEPSFIQVVVTIEPTSCLSRLV